MDTKNKAEKPRNIVTSEAYKPWRVAEIVRQRDELLKLLRSFVADIDAMRSQAPFDVRQDLPPEEGEHWFGPFENQGFDDTGDGAIFCWPNLSLLAQQAETLLGQDKLQP